MNTNLRALIFAVTITAALTATLDTVVAAERPVVRLDAVQVTAHRDNFDAAGNLKVTRLEQVSVIAHRSGFTA